MKKIITIALLVLCLVGLTSTVCLAQEDFTVPSLNTNAEYDSYPVAVVNGCVPASRKTSLPLYTSMTNTTGPACYVPASYYVRHISATSDTNWAIVLYNNVLFYAKNNDLKNLTTDFTDKTFAEGVSPYFENNTKIDTTKGDSIFKFYNENVEDFKAVSNVTEIIKSQISDSRFIGLTIIDTGTPELYYYMEITESRPNEENKYFGYVPTSCTTNPNVDFLTISNHPDYVAPKPDTETDNPALNPTDPNSTPATSNLVRNILIGVICILCIAVVLIIFKPNSKKLD